MGQFGENSESKVMETTIVGIRIDSHEKSKNDMLTFMAPQLQLSAPLLPSCCCCGERVVLGAARESMPRDKTRYTASRLELEKLC